MLGHGLMNSWNEPLDRMTFGKTIPFFSPHCLMVVGCLWEGEWE